MFALRGILNAEEISFRGGHVPLKHLQEKLDPHVHLPHHLSEAPAMVRSDVLGSFVPAVGFITTAAEREFLLFDRLRSFLLSAQLSVLENSTIIHLNNDPFYVRTSVSEKCKDDFQLEISLSVYVCGTYIEVSQVKHVTDTLT